MGHDDCWRSHVRDGQHPNIPAFQIPVELAWCPFGTSPAVSRIHRITYEMCVLQVLRDQLRCKERWVVEADRYRNLDDDVPSDFAGQRPTYSAALTLPSQAEDFLRQTQQEMRDELTASNHTLPHNTDVEILPTGKGWIKLHCWTSNLNLPICWPSRWR
jgi:hypothetical protein